MSLLSRHFLFLFFNSFRLFSDELVDQVLSELNITMGEQLPSESFHFRYSINKRFLFLDAGGAVAAGAEKTMSTADAQLAQRLDALRRP